MTMRGLGGSAFAQEITRGKNAATAIRMALEKIGEGCGPQTLAVLVAKIAVNLAIIMEVLSALESIGRDAKAERVDHKEKDGG